VAGPTEFPDGERFQALCHLLRTPIMESARSVYSGTSRRLVIALDIGTTFSGAAYALLDPGEIPQIQSVTRQAFTNFIILDVQ